MSKLAVCFAHPASRASLLRDVAPALRSHLGRTVAWENDPIKADVIVTYGHPRLPLEALKRYKYVLFIPRNWNFGGGIRHRLFDPSRLRLGTPISFDPLLSSQRYASKIRALPEGDPRGETEELLAEVDHWLRDIWLDARQTAQQRKDAFAPIEHWESPFARRRVAVISSRLEMLRLAEAELTRGNSVMLFLSYRMAFRAIQQGSFDTVFAEASMPWEPPSITDLSEAERDFSPIGADIRIAPELVQFAARSNVRNIYIVGDPHSDLRETSGFGSCRICFFGKPVHWDDNDVFSWKDVYRNFN